MTVHRVCCPMCDGSGAGDAPIPGPTCAAGMCGDCRAEGAVTEAKRARLVAAIATGTRAMPAVVPVELRAPRPTH